MARSWLSRLGEVAIPIGVSALTSRLTGGSIDPRTAEGQEGFLSLAQAGLGGLEAAEEERRRRKWQKRQAAEQQRAGMISSLAPGMQYQPKDIAAPAPSALERIGRYGGLGVGAVQTARAAQRETDRFKMETERAERAETDAGKAAGLQSGADLAVAQFDQMEEMYGPNQDYYTSIGDVKDDEDFALTDITASEESQELLKDPIVKGAFLDKQKELISNWEEQRRLREKHRLAMGKTPPSAPKAAAAFGENVTRNSPHNIDGSMVTWEGVKDQIRNDIEKTYPDITDAAIRGLLVQAETAFNKGKAENAKELGDIMNATLEVTGFEPQQVYFKRQISLRPWLNGVEANAWLADHQRKAAGITDIKGEGATRAAKFLTVEQELDQLLAAAKDPANQEYFDFIRANWETFKGKGSARLQDPKVVEILNKMKITSIMAGHALSGAAVREDEFERISNEVLMSMAAGRENFVIGATNFKNYLQRERLNIYNTARVREGKPGLSIDENGNFIVPDSVEAEETAEPRVAAEPIWGQNKEGLFYTRKSDEGDTIKVTVGDAEELYDDYKKLTTMSRDLTNEERRQLKDVDTAINYAFGSLDAFEELLQERVKSEAGKTPGQDVQITEPDLPEDDSTADVVPVTETGLPDTSFGVVSELYPKNFAKNLKEKDGVITVIDTVANNKNMIRHREQSEISSRNNKVPIWAIQSVMWNESRGDENVGIHKKSGAAGPMQVTEIALADIGKKDDYLKMAKNPRLNIEYGTQFLRDQYDRVKKVMPEDATEKQLWTQAASAYHAGFANWRGQWQSDRPSLLHRLGDTNRVR